MALWNKSKVGNVPTTPLNDIETAMSRHEAERWYGEYDEYLRANDYARMVGSAPRRPAYHNDGIESPRYREQMLAMRMRLREGDKFPFDAIHVALGKEKVFVFVLQNDNPVTFEDDLSLFPSDTLVTQLRLIAK